MKVNTHAHPLLEIAVILEDDIRCVYFIAFSSSSCHRQIIFGIY